ncbi:MAG: DAK2 domain-containing protein [bacterium]|nr:DAK2 domain-containing protein [bacterium]
MGIKYCNGKRLRRAFKACTEWLTRQEEEVNKINVFPVPDEDTGTNMSSTLREAIAETLNTKDISLNRVAQKFAEATFISAKGCSGIIISQFFKGFCEGTNGKERINAKELAQCFILGSQYTYEAVNEPKEGTILTIIREMAKKAEELSSKEDDIIKMLNIIVAHAKEILKKTTYLLPEFNK